MRRKAEYENDVELAKCAATGDSEARARVNQIVEPIVVFQNERFCKRFCADNRAKFVCTLSPDWGRSERDGLYCEWGNAGYEWMLNDLTGTKRLTRFEGRDGASLFSYVYTIANSLAFYERWKDWRFDRRDYVPVYITRLSPLAARIFRGLRAGEEPAAIASDIARDELWVENMAEQIILELTKRKRLHLLQPVTMLSLSEVENVRAVDMQSQANDGASPEAIVEKDELKKAWRSLDRLEQFVLEAMLVEKQEAEDVLHALQLMNLSVDQDAPERMNRQKLYYFKRKSLAKLARLMGAA